MTVTADHRLLFDTAFVRHQRQIYRFVTVLLPSRDVADDAFQQTCLVLLQSRDKFDPTCEFLPWAFGVARNVVREHLRSRNRIPLLLPEDLLEQLAGEQLEISKEIEGRLAALSKCLDRLHSEKRLLLDRCYSGVEAIRSIAGELRLQPMALYKRLGRIRQTLLDCVERSLAAEERE